MIGSSTNWFLFYTRTLKNKRNLDDEMLPWWKYFVCKTETMKLDIRKKYVNANLRRRMEEYLEWLLPIFYIIRHGLNKDINQIIDNSESLLTQKHLRKLELLKDSSPPNWLNCTNYLLILKSAKWAYLEYCQ